MTYTPIKTIEPDLERFPYRVRCTREGCAYVIPGFPSEKAATAAAEAHCGTSGHSVVVEKLDAGGVR